MTAPNSSSNHSKSEWKTPALVELEMGLGDVQNGFSTGTDGSGGFSSSSMS